MENNFIQMATAGHAVAYTIGPIIKHINDCVLLYFTNGFTNTVFSSVNCLWLLGLRNFPTKNHKRIFSDGNYVLFPSRHFKNEIRRLKFDVFLC